MKLPLIIALTCLILPAPCPAVVEAQTSWTPYAGSPLVGNAISPAVVYDTAAQKYRMWYIALGSAVKYAESPDGLTWSLGSDVVLPTGAPGAFDQYIHALAVVRFGDSLAMYYTASNDGVSLVVGRAVSSDGKHWIKSPGNPVLTHGPAGSWESQGVGACGVRLKNGLFEMWYGASDGSFVRTGYAQSPDGVVWSKYANNPVLPRGGPGSIDERESAIMGLDWKDSLGCAVYESIDAAGRETYSIATSPDGILWTKYAGNPVYTPAGTGWDSYGIGNGCVLWKDGLFRYWYCGYSGGTWSIGLAFLQQPAMTVVRPGLLDFGWVQANTTDTLSLRITNAGTKDSLRVISVTSNNSHFAGSPASGVIAPGDSLVLPVRYTPSATQPDSGMITIGTNDPAAATVPVPVRGHGYLLTKSPIITGIALVPNSYYQARVTWLRALNDSLGAADPVTQYSVWRLVKGSAAQQGANRPGFPELPSSALIDPAWDFVAAVPAADLLRYGYIAPVLFDNTQPYAWTTFMVAAHTKALAVYQSAPDSVQYDPPFVTSAAPATREAPREFTLHQNYPNPFNPSTVIRYDIPRAASVNLTVYSILGQEVARLVDAREEAGYHEARFDASGLASGVYFYRLRAGDFVRTMKLVLTR